MGAATKATKTKRTPKKQNPEMVALSKKYAGALKGPSGAKVIKAMGRKPP
jgi:hypothetical protein